MRKEVWRILGRQYDGLMRDPSFGDSARRHLADAELLNKADRVPNADHLCGIAAECSLKALVVDVLGGRVANGYAEDPYGKALKSHINSLWGRISVLVRGKQASEVMELFNRTSPFVDWDVSDRYTDGSHLTPETVEKHLEGARLAARALESAKLSNLDGGF